MNCLQLPCRHCWHSDWLHICQTHKEYSGKVPHVPLHWAPLPLFLWGSHISVLRLESKQCVIFQVKLKWIRTSSVSLSVFRVVFSSFCFWGCTCKAEISVTLRREGLWAIPKALHTIICSRAKQLPKAEQRKSGKKGAASPSGGWICKARQEMGLQGKEREGSGGQGKGG